MQSHYCWLLKFSKKIFEVGAEFSSEDSKLMLDANQFDIWVCVYFFSRYFIIFSFILINFKNNPRRVFRSFKSAVIHRRDYCLYCWREYGIKSLSQVVSKGGYTATPGRICP